MIASSYLFLCHITGMLWGHCQCQYSYHSTLRPSDLRHIKMTGTCFALYLSFSFRNKKGEHLNPGTSAFRVVTVFFKRNVSVISSCFMAPNIIWLNIRETHLPCKANDNESRQSMSPVPIVFYWWCLAVLDHMTDLGTLVVLSILHQ